MEIIRTSQEMQRWSLEQKRRGKGIAFVPTMGALHQGHLSLLDRARGLGDVGVLSVFVNPTQFGPQEDFKDYPRDLDTDRKLAEQRKVDILFHPTEEQIYPPGDQTTVVVTELTRGLCGPFRPGHFRGVVTVVSKLLNIVQPDTLLLGEKDFQQLVVIRRLVRDLHFPVEVVGVATGREDGGLALSSRNAYLSPEEKKQAERIFATLTELQRRVQGGEVDVKALQAFAKESLARGGSVQVEYLEIVDPQTLLPLERVEREARAVTAVRVGGKRLIDNLALIL